MSLALYRVFVTERAELEIVADSPESADALARQAWSRDPIMRRRVAEVAEPTLTVVVDGLVPSLPG